MGDYLLIDLKNEIKQLAITAVNDRTTGQRPEILFGRDALEDTVETYPRLITFNIESTSASPSVELNNVLQEHEWTWSFDFRIGIGGTKEDAMDEVAPYLQAIYQGLRNKQLLSQSQATGCRLRLTQYVLLLGYVRDIPVYRQGWAHPLYSYPVDAYGA